MGLGRFGGNLGVVRWLAEHGADVLVTDLGSEADLSEPLAAISSLIDTGAVELRLGEHNASDFTGADIVVASPAVPRPWDNRYLRAAVAAGVPVTTEIRLLVDRLPHHGRTIGVTGTSGKSTTSAMIAHVLRRVVEPGERVRLGGNIGGSLLPDLADIDATDWIVLELSSAQLCWLAGTAVGQACDAWAPRTSAITGFEPNHIDWHGSLEHYEQSKAHIVGAPCTHVVTHARSLEPVVSWCRWGRHEPQVTSVAAGMIAGPLAIPGAHNLENASLAIEAALAATGRQDDAASRESAIEAVAGFPGLEHRLERLGRFRLPSAGEFEAFNDSKCTTPGACALALWAFESGPGAVGLDRVHLIAGGYDKEVDLGSMIAPSARCAGVYTVGATGPSIAAGVSREGGRSIEAGTIGLAVEAAIGSMRDGDVLLLSPGCASWDQFANYVDRAGAFRDSIERFAGGSVAPEASEQHASS